MGCGGLAPCFVCRCRQARVYSSVEYAIVPLHVRGQCPPNPLLSSRGAGGFAPCVKNPLFGFPYLMLHGITIRGLHPPNPQPDPLLSVGGCGGLRPLHTCACKWDSHSSQTSSGRVPRQSA